jgi:YbbR domain-containing protein
MALTTAQRLACAQFAAAELFRETVAIYGVDDVLAAINAIDNALDTTLATAVTAVGGSTTVIQGLASVIPSPVSGATAAQKTMLLVYVVEKRAGII